jgi:hypothetical protein
MAAGSKQENKKMLKVDLINHCHVDRHGIEYKWGVFDETGYLVSGGFRSHGDASAELQRLETPADPYATHRKLLVHAATVYDRKMMARPKFHQSIYALGHYLRRIDDCLEDVRKGATPRQALIAGFNGPLLTALLKALGESKATQEETDAKERRGGLVYVPVTGETNWL